MSEREVPWSKLPSVSFNRSHVIYGLLLAFLVALPLAGFLESAGFLGIALGSLVVALVLANAE